MSQASAVPTEAEEDILPAVVEKLERHNHLVPEHLLTSMQATSRMETLVDRPFVRVTLFTLRTDRVCCSGGARRGNLEGQRNSLPC